MTEGLGGDPAHRPQERDRGEDAVSEVILAWRPTLHWLLRGWIYSIETKPGTHTSEELVRDSADNDRAKARRLERLLADVAAELTDADVPRSAGRHLDEPVGDTAR